MGAGLKRAFAATKATRVQAVWCVKHRDGWCATKSGRRYAEGITNAPTKCKHYVTLPCGYERRVPTCVECIEAMKG
jgi:pyrimidine deaminase RibD-like protein